MPVQWWPTVCNAGSILIQHWESVSCLLCITRENNRDNCSTLSQRWLTIKHHDASMPQFSSLETDLISYKVLRSYIFIKLLIYIRRELLWMKISMTNSGYPLSLHDALKHHFTSLKTDLIFLQPRVLERKFPWNWFTNTWQFSLIFKPHQIIFIHCKSRIATAICGL